MRIQLTEYRGKDTYVLRLPDGSEILFSGISPVAAWSYLTHTCYYLRGAKPKTKANHIRWWLESKGTAPSHEQGSAGFSQIELETVIHNLMSRV